MSSTRSTVYVSIDDAGKPANIPNYETIIRQCFEQGPRQETTTNITGVRLTLEKKTDDDVSDIWVKFGIGIAMSEAFTQRFVAQYLHDNNIAVVRAPRVYRAFKWGNLGYIVSEFIDGPMCDKSDAALIASAVQALINIPSPSSTPGPVGGGLIEHPFFVDRESSVWYESVEELQDHVNRASVPLFCPSRISDADS